MTVLLSSEQTGGQFSMIEGVMPSGGDGGSHVHHNEDETMYLLEGALEVTIGDLIFTLKAGETYFAPRGVPQRLRNLGDRPARGVLVTTPGGFDGFVAKAGIPQGSALPMAPPTPEDVKGLIQIAAAYGIEILAPPDHDGRKPAEVMSAFEKRGNATD
jgi:mannose-6-phosphate isomerase-like protein (cupin superfamily)